MTDRNARFSGGIPEHYDRHLGPVIFEPYARDLAHRVHVPAQGSLLELACGTGIATRRMRERMPADSRLVASDLNPAMIDHARARLGDLDGIDWRTADAQELPFDDRAFDVVAMQFGLMFVPRKDDCAREVRRVLAPGGRFVVSVWDRMESNPFSEVTHGTIARLFPDDPPDFYRVPFGFADPAALAALLNDAGFRDVTVENVPAEARAESARSFAVGLIEGNPVRLAIEEKDAPLGPVVDEVTAELARRFGDRPCVSPLRAWVATARA